jgi:hypothetical protein
MVLWLPPLRGALVRRLAGRSLPAKARGRLI